MDFRRRSAASLAEDVRRGRIGARELVTAALERIDALDDRLNAFVAVDDERALAAAHAVDELVAHGEDPGPLAGIPIGVKDLEDALGFRTTRGSLAWADAPPAVADSVLVARLKAAGCIVVGKTNTPELGWKADTDNRLFGATRNPWDLTRSPGGSSGGSAAAVAAGLVPLATGSDGGGSIRIPSSVCGLTGIKPSLGRVPLGGPRPPSWPQLSTRGPIALRAADLALALDAVIGPDPTDLDSLPMPEACWAGAVAEPHVPMAVAWSPTLGYATVDDEIRSICERTLDVLEELGAHVVERERVFPEDPYPAWEQLTAAYNLRTLEQFRGTEVWERLDPDLVASLGPAVARPAVALVRALDRCHELNARLVELFHDVRVLLTPTVAGQTPPSGGLGTINGVPDANWVRLTYAFNMTRSPAGTVCVGRTGDGLPVGLQVVGPQHGDLVVLRALAAIEAAVGLDLAPPLA